MEPILVRISDGKCRQCGGQLQITECEDSLMTVECTNESCCDCYVVEPDAFHDGGIDYWPRAMEAMEECDGD